MLLPAGSCSAGTGTDSTSTRRCPCCPPTWGTSIPPARTGMSRRRPSCWRWRPNGATAPGEAGMSALAPALEAFFTDRLISQRHASPHTIAGYRDAWRLLLRFIHARTGKDAAQLDLADLGRPVISAFLEHLERAAATAPAPATPGWPPSTPSSATRRCAPRARRPHRPGPGHPAQARDRADVSYLTRPELDALLAAPDQPQLGRPARSRPARGGSQTGLRVSELTGLTSRRRPGHRPPRPVPRQGPQGTRRPPHHPERARTAHMAEGARGNGGRAGVLLPGEEPSAPA